MNFLSHYYFERNNENSYEVLGCILPDLLKNVDKKWHIHPEKSVDATTQSVTYQSLLTGWKRHLYVDRLFHNAHFFFHHQHELKKKMKKVVDGTQIKPFFLGHIGLELCLDNLLITQQKVNVDNLYQHLRQIEEKQIEDFLLLNGISGNKRFITFFNSFKKEEYLHNYDDEYHLSYAIKRICMRIWEKSLSSQQEQELTEILKVYISYLKADFMVIFDDIELQLLNG